MSHPPIKPRDDPDTANHDATDNPANHVLRAQLAVHSADHGTRDQPNHHVPPSHPVAINQPTDCDAADDPTIHLPAAPLADHPSTVEHS